MEEAGRFLGKILCCTFDALRCLEPIACVCDLAFDFFRFLVVTTPCIDAKTRKG